MLHRGPNLAAISLRSPQNGPRAQSDNFAYQNILKRPPFSNIQDTALYNVTVIITLDV